jgi:HK97 family phage prohead protease
MAADFSGYVTRSGVKCSDGRTITPAAFKAMDGQQVPLVWQHQHNEPANVLGHVILSHKEDGVWGEGFFNETPSGQQAKALVNHKDIRSLSIYANQLVQQAMNVMHGVIREVSLVLSGANPGAFIQNLAIQHDDGEFTVADDQAIIYPGDELQLAHATPSTTVQPPKQVQVPGKGPMPSAPAAGGDGPSVEDVFNTLDEKQKELFYAVVGAAAQQDAMGDGQAASAAPATPTPTQGKGNDPVTRNVFDQTGDPAAPAAAGHTLSHSDIQGIFAAAHKGGSLKDAVDEFALAHGIDDISTLFPADRPVTDSPDFISRRTAWVAGVLNGTRKTPFSRIRSWTADLTIDQARAKGYVKASLKKEEYFRIAKRVTTPQTVYKKQKLDRDDILDITDFDVVTWLQTEMRIMLDEELARAILIGDGRAVDDADKIDETHVRPIYSDDELYVTTLNIDLSDASSSADEIVDGIVSGMRFYRGTGNPVLYTTMPYLSRMLLAKDTLGRRLYATQQELAAAMGVSEIITCEVMEQQTALIGVIVNLNDYTIGMDRGGQVSMFDFFDIDYNQYKYLMETRMSGALIKYKSALVVKEFSGAGGMLAEPAAPTFNADTGVVTIPAFSGLHLTYVIVAADGTEGSDLSVGAQTAIAQGAYVVIRAKPASTYEFATETHDWTFRRNSA